MSEAEQADNYHCARLRPELWQKRLQRVNRCIQPQEIFYNLAVEHQVGQMFLRCLAEWLLGFGRINAGEADLVLSLGTVQEGDRNLRIVCVVFFVIGAVLNATFSFIGVSQTAYILANAISFLIYIFFANAIYNAKQ
jgi:hypothetical protein